MFLSSGRNWGCGTLDSRRTWRGRDLSGLPPSASELGAQDSMRDVWIVDDIMLLGGLGGSAEGGGV